MWRKVWFPFYLLVFVLPLFALAAWMLLLAPQELWVRIFGAVVLTTAGLWNLWRGWIRRPR